MVLPLDFSTYFMIECKKKDVNFVIMVLIDHYYRQGLKMCWKYTSESVKHEDTHYTSIEQRVI